jgi:hypothetical protein
VIINAISGEWKSIALRVVKRCFMRTKALLSFPYLFVYKDTISAKRLSSISAFIFQEEETSWGFKGFRFQISVS